ncbi:hypothetical protein QGN29_00895 [Temperatibacter marinus]|uniref:Capsule polysaccharide biosynthesis protein n=1 Tax=Temperatibacter marinus TaxID=1456591 RepID=A0AA52H9H6_9PROT|nr:hypothetical protein [Temperatibacter marinus]WND02919.1 hypothetical protein QGN29_00895 [Temperatibacter marinus]
MARAFTKSRGIKKDPMIRAALEMPLFKDFSKAGSEDGDVIVGWGQKDNTRRARALARQKGLPYIRLEDGFISYLSHPEIDDRRISLIMDQTGIYYDARKPSDLENLLKDRHWFDETLKAQSERAMHRIRQWKITKYNHASNDLSEETQLSILKAKESQKEIILLVDQTFGDKGIEYGLADENSFEEMVRSAKENHPSALFIIKTHPDVVLGKKKGYLNQLKTLKDMDHYISTDHVPPLTLINQVDHVYTVTSQMGFEALLCKKPVHCFGMPFYAGWGLTYDRLNCPRRSETVTLEELFAAAFIVYPIYVCPYSKKRCSLEQILDYLIADKQMPRLKARRVIAADFSLWKKGFIGDFIQGSDADIVWIKRGHVLNFAYKPGDALLVWGQKFQEFRHHFPDFLDIWRIEDGFLRSIGLGSDLRRPASLVLDKIGMYYDASSPSALENFLSNHDFSVEDRARATAFIAKMKAGRLSKYNVGKKLTKTFDNQGKSIILVTGQVEGDASLAAGSPKIKDNASLLQTVRKNNPNDYIIYKAHPDVLGGNRAGKVCRKTLEKCADAVVDDVDIQDCIQIADSVHVMTSGSGLEAMMMGKEVQCYGMPFYAGWGLTVDHLQTDRRGRTLTLEDIIYAAYIVYPTYVSWPSGARSSPEALLGEIKSAKRKNNAVEVRGFWSRLRSYLRKGLYLTEALLK